MDFFFLAVLRVGLTGGLASGKSSVGATFASLGCHLIQADVLGREALLPSGDTYAAVVEAFGSGILNEDGTIDRRRLATEVFEQPERLGLLNSLVHPAVFRRQEELIAGYEAVDPQGIVVVEAAIMIETGSYKRCDKLIVVICSEEQQIERAMHRDGVTREEVLARLRAQMPLSEKRKYADYVIDTSGTREQTAEQVRTVYHSLVEASRPQPRPGA